MIAFQVADEFLDLDPNTSFSIEINNPLWQTETIPGMFILPFNVKKTPKNRRLLGFPDLLANTTLQTNTVRATIYVLNLVWKRGTLILRGTGKNDFSVNFQSDAGDVQSQIKDVKLNAVNLGTQTVAAPMAAAFAALASQSYPAVNYAVFPVYNPDFYGSAYAGYSHVLNYYKDGAYFTNPYLSGNPYTVTPFPYLIFILKAAFASFGYRLTGSFVTDPEIQRLVFYNTYALDKLTSGVNVWNDLITWKNHVPEIKLGDLLIQLQKLFCLGCLFNSVDKTLEIVPRKLVLADNAYVDLTGKAEADFTSEVNGSNGFTLEQALDGADALTESLATDWARYAVDAGGETIGTAFSAPFMWRGADYYFSSRQFLVPYAKQKGNSPEYGLNTNNKFSPRLLFYRGLQADGGGATYPLGTTGTQNYAGAEISGANYSLAWDGAKGLYQVWWKPYLDFLKATRAVERNIRLDVVDLFALDFKRKYRLDNLAFVWTKISTSVSLKSGIKTAKVNLLKTNL